MRRVVRYRPGTAGLYAALFAAGGTTGDAEPKRRAITAARRVVIGLLAVVALEAFAVASASADSFYIGDQTDNTYKTFDVTGSPLTTFIPFTQGGLTGPRGILHLSNGSFLVAYQNPCNCSLAGEIDQFNGNGTLNRVLVSSSDPHAPFAPRGIILAPDGHTLYVADFGKDNIGAVEKYDLGTGKFLGDLNFDKWANSSASNGEFHPRGLVFDRYGMLYLTLFSEKDFQHLGWILRYNVATGAVGVVASYNPTATDQCSPYLSRPEGVAVGPDGNLYVVGRQPDTSRLYDKILAFDPTTGACRHSINLETQPGQPHTYARALIFGPRGELYLPMTVCTTATADKVPQPICPAVSPGATDAGSVRAYVVSTGLYSDIVPEFASGTASDPSVYYTGEPTRSAVGWWYVTFGGTNPTTLAYSG